MSSCEQRCDGCPALTFAGAQIEGIQVRFAELRARAAGRLAIAQAWDAELRNMTPQEADAVHYDGDREDVGSAMEARDASDGFARIAAMRDGVEREGLQITLGLYESKITQRKAGCIAGAPRHRFFGGPVCQSAVRDDGLPNS